MGNGAVYVGCNQAVGGLGTLVTVDCVTLTVCGLFLTQRSSESTYTSAVFLFFGSSTWSALNKWKPCLPRTYEHKARKREINARMAANHGRTTAHKLLWWFCVRTQCARHANTSQPAQLILACAQEASKRRTRERSKNISKTSHARSPSAHNRRVQ